MSPFSAITFGPYVATYHRVQTADPALRSSLFAFLEQVVLPQVDEPFDRIRGSLSAEHDDDRYCGPNSAIKDIYRIKLSFERKDSADTLDNTLLYRPQSTAWAAQPKTNRLRLLTRRRQEARTRLAQKVESLAKRIHQKVPVDLSCPHCKSALSLVDAPDLFDLLCKAGCFKYNFHREARTGEFLHGHLFVNLLD